jgi:hypothetical protein
LTVRLTTSLVILLCSAGFAGAAEDVESLDEDFLAYLAEFEGDDDDWTIVEAPVAPAPAKPANELAPKTTTKAPANTSATKSATPDSGSKR